MPFFHCQFKKMCYLCGVNFFIGKMLRCIKYSPVLALCVLLVSFGGCARFKSKRFNPSHVKFEVGYNAVFEDQIYPSLILGLSHLLSTSSDSTTLFSASATAPCPNAVLKIVIDSTNLSYATTTQVVLSKMGYRYTVHPVVKWRYDRLYSLRRHGNVDVTVHCIINDEEVDVKNLHLNYRSANDCLLSVRDTNGVTQDFRWMFAAYVNEDSPYIDEILSGMLDQGVVSRIVGYQYGSAEVSKQAEAIWYYVLEHGISYASISTTSNPAKNANVQHIRFFEDVYKLRQANCIDACVFFASVMRKIGLKPVIFVVPGHAYLGYYTDKNRKNIKLLETTVSQWVNLPLLTRYYEQTLAANPEATGSDRLPMDVWNKYKGYLTSEERARWTKGDMTIDELKRCVSHNLFIKATEYKVKDYETNKANFVDNQNTKYQMLDIEQLRAFVQPI